MLGRVFTGYDWWFAEGDVFCNLPNLCLGYFYLAIHHERSDLGAQLAAYGTVKKSGSS